MNLAKSADWPQPASWTEICPLEDILPDMGVAALVDGQQVAVFRVGETDQVYALGNHDPFSNADVLSRGILGDIAGTLVVASPVYKQHFALSTGCCVEDDAVSVPVYAVRIVDGVIQVGL